MSVLNYTVTPKILYKEIVKCISVGLVPMITSSPGMGKSSIGHLVAKDHNLKLIDFRAGQALPEDLNGFPQVINGVATFVPFDVFPTEDTPLPEGKDGWLLFLDEITSANKAVQAALYKLILDRYVGQKKLHRNVAIIAAGNKLTDKAVVNQMSTALQSRVIHYELELSFQEWMEWAIEHGMDSRITGFLNYQPNRLMDFRPDHQDKTFPCPRTWEFLSLLIKDEEVDPNIAHRVAGAVGGGVGTEFITFAQEFNRIPSYHKIVTEGATLSMPSETSTRYAIISMLIQRFEEDDLEKIIVFLKRFSPEFQVVFCRGANVRNKELRYKHKAFSQYLLDMMRHM